MNKSIKKILIHSILAGISIGIAGTIYLLLDSFIIGSLFFSIGLFIVVSNQLELYTGRIGYFIDYNKNERFSEFKRILIIWFGNLIGILTTTLLLTNTRLKDKLIGEAISLYQIKNSDSLLSLFILSIFCGILMFIAVDAYRNLNNSLTKNIMIILPVSVFVMCGFEHSIANMYYYTIGMIYDNSNAIVCRDILQILVISIGNAVGAIGFNSLLRCKKGENYE